MDQYGLMTLNGLSWGMTVFLTAAGLTLVFGILHVLNFAHGGFVMLGAYLAYSLLARLGEPSFWAFMLATVVCAVALGVLGAAVDRLVFQRLRGVSESYSLIATYALLLLCQGAVKVIWGIDFLSVPPPPVLRGATEIAGVLAPNFVLFVIGCGVLAFLLLDYLVHRTELGKTVQSVAVDPWMASLLGVNVRLVLTGTVVVGIALAGVAGALLSVNQSLSPNMGSALIIQAFGVIIVGGMGNIRGAFLAAILLGIITAIGDRVFAEVPGLFFYVALISILMWRPQGLLKGLR
ncbi:branched-chain amino acid ABC transporter permease [Achromobacter pestifer]|uniref:Branched-chain amino acid ABC transporter permease n=1 Tax=Achromobacter pestifer TaxID=1353889 RepID=A0A7D4DXP4_9BURK|nr:branched-chain amino acid ABC transporter permease [Achromobacter pestifer]QKH36495.1 branched-chain amino acid ABC transporter permease [Achromobacter pestifer]